ncbi:MAG: transposase [Bacteroidota bacterium]
MKQYLGLTRYWYNKAIEYLQKEGTKASLSEVRKIQKQGHPEWAFDCPQRVREHAISDAVNAVKAAKRKCKQGGGFQKVKFRSKKDSRQRFGFDKKSIKECFCFSKKKDRIFFDASEEIQVGLEGVQITRQGDRWFLILPQTRQVKCPENQRFPFAALDPGVRTFITLYSPHLQGSFGAGDFGRIQRLCYHLDDLISRISKESGKKRRRMKKAATRMRWRIRDLIDDLHRKVAFFLVTRFDVIILPTYETSQMVSKLRSKTARAMLTWSFYRFKQHLKAKAEEYSAMVLDVCEAYTSKTCSYCGKVHNIGSKKRMRCSCGVDEDRDMNGARGIALRSLSALSVSTILRDALEDDLSTIVN